VLCKAADGNTAVSLFHSALGNLVGAFFTPSVLFLLLGNDSSVSFVDVLTKISETLLLPLVVGQIVHNVFAGNKIVLFVQKISGDITKFLLLVIIWNTFCDTFAKKLADVATQDFIIVICIVVAFHITVILFAISVYRLKCFKLNRRTQVSAWFCSTQKTIVMGIPLVKIIFEGNPNIGLIQIPLLMYHPTQTLLASFFLGKINAWVKKDDEEERDETASLLHNGNGGPEGYSQMKDDTSLDIGPSATLISSQRSFTGDPQNSVPASPSDSRIRVE